MDIEKEYIPVTVDKSHIITIGERLYTESIEFVREIVNNAYDADASLVDHYRKTVSRSGQRPGWTGRTETML
jgi:hypothetical protein